MPKFHHQPALQTKSLKQAQAFTSRVWAKHESKVPAGNDYSSHIVRIPMGGSHFCIVDCTSPIEVNIEGCAHRSFLYLPLEGTMKIHVDGKALDAMPGGPALIPSMRSYDFSASPVQCIVVELRTERLLCELESMGITGVRIPSLGWPPDDADARTLKGLLHFAMGELTEERKVAASPPHLRHLESLITSCVARMIAGCLEIPEAIDCKVGCRTADEITRWLQGHIGHDLDMVELALFAGLSLRSLERRFLQYYHRCPTTYLRELRLDAAHAALSQPACSTSVTEVAMGFHFDHLGRFSASYRQRFGENPSVTLSRAKRSQS